ncbi:hypothetical protein FVE85_2622 [Porphyridium purpureum]|uniref:YCII-related domain-containing protein n=1 Tax=Porphyridium purpureum TaxID=35688 RepID=A0A5J4YSA6_PORPP|nr:hypothetical protein FVE85_2622 [Porphyridium purpureum]|eukprot:POR7684..scf227_4
MDAFLCRVAGGATRDAAHVGSVLGASIVGELYRAGVDNAAPEVLAVVLAASDAQNATAVSAAALQAAAAAAGLEGMVVRPWKVGIHTFDPPLHTTGAAGKVLTVMLCDDKPDSVALRAATRPAHLEFLKASPYKGMIGPFPHPSGEGGVGTCLIIDCDQPEQVAGWAALDPYVSQADLFATVQLFRFVGK